MKRHLLFGVVSAAAALGVSAAEPVTALQAVKAAEQVSTSAHRFSAAPRETRKLAPGVVLTINDAGFKKLHITRPDAPEPIRTPRANAKAKASAPEGFNLYESFEGWDGVTPDWVPEGWTVDKKGDTEADGHESWDVCAAATGFLPDPADGKYYAGINFSTVAQDEWLITPEVTVEQDMQLTYWLYLEPFFLFNLDNFDFDAYDWVGERKVAATLQVWVQPEGGEWEMIHDYFDDYSSYSATALIYASPQGLEKKTESLAKFAGKKVKVGFRYVGTDGNTMLIDAVGVGYPSLDGISYMDPFHTLYWGFDGSTDMGTVNGAIAQYPVYSPLTWTNTTYNDDATYSWSYCDPVTAAWTTDNDPDELTVTYIPDYSSATSKRNNWFYPPVLNASAPGASPGSFSAPYTYFQAGGMFEMKFNNGTEIDDGDLIPFNFNNVGIGVTNIDDPEIGDMALPVFGHNSNTDQYWLNYSLNGEEAAEGDYARLVGVGNMFFASEAPLVVNGVTAYGLGKVGADVVFTIEIHRINAEFEKNPENPDVMARATCKGSDILTADPASNSTLVIPFTFEEPVVLKTDENTGAFFICLKGFNAPGVEYFAPYQSVIDDPNNLGLGYMLKEINIAATGRGKYTSMPALSYKENGDYVDPYVSFAIGLNAEYPWLTCEETEVAVPTDGSAIQVPLGSYYNGNQLTVEASDCLEATVSGRYDECVLSVKQTKSSTDSQGSVKISGPGVELTLPVKLAAGIIGVGTDSQSTISAVYDLSGRCIEPAQAKTGVYVVKYTDGTVAKAAVR